MNRSLTIDYLRSFIAIVDTGTFAQAAGRVGRTVSALSLQINKLEEQTGQRLFEKSGRRMVLTAAGQNLLDHARTILSANDAAVAALSAERLSGTVRLGVLHDAMESVIADVLAEFSRLHPLARLDIHVDTSRALVDALEADKLDQVIAFKVETRLPSDLLADVPMLWIARPHHRWNPDQPLPLVLLEEPCAFRRAALTALDHAQIPWRIVVTSASLAAVRTSVEAGLGATVRTEHFLEALGTRAQVLRSLPPLPTKQLLLYRRVPNLTSRTGRALRAACLERFGNKAAELPAA
ncbi:MAG: HTH-type transcriptional regulator HdfR [Pseudomonadota bacterium]